MESFVMDQDLIVNAVCIYEANKLNIDPEDVVVDLFYDDEMAQPFGAEIWEGDTMHHEISMVELIAAIRFCLDDYSPIDPMSASIDLQFDDDAGFSAMID